ncbi:MAG: LysM peptidoglycan-binding domain-containing protein [Thermoguttaceae bacterium]|nr:LysM peptidoglycan-binding domain-containing protein [Thermoguttaceae bacterium]
MLDTGSDRDASHVILMKTPIQRTPVQPEVEQAVQNEPNPAPSHIDTPTETAPGSYPARSDDEYEQGGYPNSKLWEHEPSTSMIPPSSNSSQASFLTKEDLFTPEFLNESPMVEKGKPGNSLTRISQNGGLDVIPRESGINGRSIYGLREHKIEDGDTLEQMAARYLGDPARANEIYELNQNILTNKEELPIGLKLRIPDRYQ